MQNPAAPRVQRGFVMVWDHLKVTAMAFVMFDVLIGFMSRYQIRKFQDSPARATAGTMGCGMFVRSMLRENSPLGPLFRIPPPPEKL